MANIKSKYFKLRNVRYDSEAAVRRTLIELLLYLIFLFATTVVAVYGRHLYMFYFNNTVEQHFIKADVSTGFNDNIKFKDIVTTTDFWNFLKHNFLVGLHDKSDEKIKPNAAGGGGGNGTAGEAGGGETGSDGKVGKGEGGTGSGGTGGGADGGTGGGGTGSDGIAGGGTGRGGRGGTGGGGTGSGETGSGEASGGGPDDRETGGGGTSAGGAGGGGTAGERAGGTDGKSAKGTGGGGGGSTGRKRSVRSTTTEVITEDIESKAIQSKILHNKTTSNKSGENASKKSEIQKSSKAIHEREFEQVTSKNPAETTRRNKKTIKMGDKNVDVGEDSEKNNRSESKKFEKDKENSGIVKYTEVGVSFGNDEIIDTTESKNNSIESDFREAARQKRTEEGKLSAENQNAAKENSNIKEKFNDNLKQKISEIFQKKLSEIKDRVQNQEQLRHNKGENKKEQENSKNELVLKDESENQLPREIKEDKENNVNGKAVDNTAIEQDSILRGLELKTNKKAIEDKEEVSLKPKQFTDQISKQPKLQEISHEYPIGIPMHEQNERFSEPINTVRDIEVSHKRSTKNDNPHVFLKENVLLGPPRLRQIRVEKHSCHVNILVRKFFDACYARYSRWVEDVSTDYKGTKFYTLYDSGATVLWGRVTSYIGAGYIKYLTFDIDQNKAILLQLEETDWIDRGTRVAVMEFGLFNPNTDLFANVKILGELPPTGGIMPSIKLQTLKLYSVWTEDAFIITCAIIFYVFIIAYTVQEIAEMKQTGFKQYVRSKWNWMDLSVLVMGYLSFAYNIWHPIYMNALVQHASENPDIYHSLDTACILNLLYMNMMAICAFLVWIKFFKYISFNKTMMQFSATLKRCSRDLLGFAFMFFIVFLAYALLGMLLFGTTHPDFRNFGESLLTMVRMVLGDFEYTAIEKAHRVLGPIFFLSFILLVIFILLNMFLAIINETYIAVKQDIKHGESHLGSYISKQCKRMCARCAKCCNRKNQSKAKKNESDLDETKDKPLTSASEGEDKQTDNSKTPIRMRRSEILRTYFRRVPTNNQEFMDRLDRLEKRVDLIENIMERLIGNFDKLLRKA